MTVYQGLAGIYIRRKREREAIEKAKKVSSKEKFGIDSAHLNMVLAEELATSGLNIFINRTQVNIEDEDTGDKFYLTCSKRHSNVRVDYLVRGINPDDSAPLQRLFKDQMGSLNFSEYSGTSKKRTILRFMCPKEDLASTISRICARVKPNINRPIH